MTPNSRPEPLGYPRELERRVVLHDGTAVQLRPIRPDDAARLEALYARLSADTIYKRFFTRMPTLSPELARHFANVDHERRLAMVAEIPAAGDSVIIGVGRLDPTETPTAAELALVVEDRWQRLGLGGILLDEILRAGEQRGYHEFRADVLTYNRRMLQLLSSHTDVTRRRTQDGVTELVFRRRPSTTVAASEA